MFDIGLPELMIILVLGLVLLGPDRLPGVIRQFTGFIRMLRSSYGDALAVFKDQLGDVQEDIDAIRGEISSIQGEVRSTAEDVQKDVEKVESEVKTAGADIQRGLDDTAKEAAGTRPDQAGAEANAPAAVAATQTPTRPKLSERGAAWTPLGTHAGGGSPYQQDLFAGLMRSLQLRFGDDWLEVQADIYRDLGARAAARSVGDDQDIAALVRTYADMQRSSRPEGGVQIIETGKDFRLRMRQCPYSYVESDGAAHCMSCGAYGLAFLQERAENAKWESRGAGGDQWCELVVVKPPPPPKPEPVAADPAIAENGDGGKSSGEAAQSSKRQESTVGTGEAAKQGSEFASLAQAYSAPADETDSPDTAAAKQSSTDAISTEEASPEDGVAQASAAEPVVVEAAVDSDAAEKAGSGKKETSA